jgi:Flp pilus assembly protein TadD
MSRKIASRYVLGLCGLLLLVSTPDAQALPKLPFFGKKEKTKAAPPAEETSAENETEEETEAPAPKKSSEPRKGGDITEGEEGESEMSSDEGSSKAGASKTDMSESSEDAEGEHTSEESDTKTRKLPGEKVDRSVLEETKEFEEPEKVKENLGVDPRRHYMIAKDLLAQKQYKACLTEVNKALALNPHYWDAMYVGCLSLQMQERNEEAIRKYRRLVKFKPDMIEAHVNLGVLLKKTGHLDEAESEYKKAIEINFYKVDPHYNLANLLIEKGDLEGALQELKACVKLAPRNAWVHNNLGVIYQKRNYLEEAEEEFKKAIKLEPANRTFAQNLNSVKSMMKKKDVGA